MRWRQLYEMKQRILLGQCQRLYNAIQVNMVLCDRLLFAANSAIWMSMEPVIWLSISSSATIPVVFSKKLLILQLLFLMVETQSFRCCMYLNLQEVMALLMNGFLNYTLQLKLNFFFLESWGVFWLSCYRLLSYNCVFYTCTNKLWIIKNISWLLWVVIH